MQSGIMDTFSACQKHPLICGFGTFTEHVNKHSEKKCKLQSASLAKTKTKIALKHTTQIPIACLYVCDRCKPDNKHMSGNMLKIDFA